MVPTAQAKTKPTPYSVWTPSHQVGTTLGSRQQAATVATHTSELAGGRSVFRKPWFVCTLKPYNRPHTSKVNLIGKPYHKNILLGVVGQNSKLKKWIVHQPDDLLLLRVGGPRPLNGEALQSLLPSFPPAGGRRCPFQPSVCDSICLIKSWFDQVSIIVKTLWSPARISKRFVIPITWSMVPTAQAKTKPTPYSVWTPSHQVGTTLGSRQFLLICSRENFLILSLTTIMIKKISCEHGSPQKPERLSQLRAVLL